MASPTPRIADSGAEPSLAPLLLAAQAGERNAFATIYERFARVVHGIVIGQCSTTEAEDVTQEVFLVIQRKIGQVESAEALPGWICRVARNAAIDYVRRDARRPTIVALPEVPAREQGDDRLAQHMLERVRELPEAYRKTLVLRLVEGMSGAEIATVTGMTHGSVRVNLHRGMAMLRERLEKDGWP